MKSYDVTAIYESGKTMIVKHSSEKSALETIKVLQHNAKIENEKVTIVKGWNK